MSQQNKYDIVCPQCDQAMEVDLYDSINVTTHPELRGQLMGNQINRVTCENCGFSFRIDKALLYHDAGRRFMVYWIPMRDGVSTTTQQQFRDSISAMTGLLPADVEVPHVHLVLSRVELVERIFLLEAGLDERLVEYVKYLIYTRNLERLDPAGKVLLFNAQDSTPEQLCFVIQDSATQQLEGMLQYSREAYEALRGVFDQDEQTPTLLEIFPGPYISARALLLSEEA